MDMFLAVRKDEGSIPGGGFHYMLHPIAMNNDFEQEVFEHLGYVVICVDAETGERLLKSAREALKHQMEVAVLTEKELKNGGG